MTSWDLFKSEAKRSPLPPSVRLKYLPHVSRWDSGRTKKTRGWEAHPLLQGPPPEICTGFPRSRPMLTIQVIVLLPCCTLPERSPASPPPDSLTEQPKVLLHGLPELLPHAGFCFSYLLSCGPSSPPRTHHQCQETPMLTNTMRPPSYAWRLLHHWCLPTGPQSPSSPRVWENFLESRELNILRSGPSADCSTFTHTILSSPVQDRQCGCRSDDTMTKLILDLLAMVIYVNLLVLYGQCTEQESNKETPLRFRSGRLFSQSSPSMFLYHCLHERWSHQAVQHAGHHPAGMSG